MAAQLVRREYEPFITNGDAHSLIKLGVRAVALAVARFSKTRPPRIIADSVAPFHLMASPRILCVGLDHTLLFFLRDVLKKIDTEIVRCPSGRCSFCLIESEIKYSLLLFDEVLRDMTGVELAQFTRKLKHRRSTPIVILSKEKARGVVAGLFFEKPYDVGSIVETMSRLLNTDEL